MTDIEIHLSQRLSDDDYHKITVAMSLAYRQGRADAIDEFADWLVKQGMLGSRVVCDGEITDYGKLYAKRFKEQLKEKKE